MRPITTNAVSSWPERNAVLQLVEGIREQQATCTRFSARVTLDSDIASQLVAALSSLPMGTEAMARSPKVVEVKFDRRQVFAVAIYIVGYGGHYEGKL